MAGLLIATLAAIAWGCAGTGSGSSGGNNNTGSPAAIVQMTGNHSFNPVNATVPAGSIVQWTNIDTAHHTVASDTNLSGFNSDSQFPTGLPGSSTFNFRVPAGTPSGTVLYYHCEFHGAAGDGSHIGSGMAGSVTVQ